MILIYLDHSVQDDYYQIDSIVVDLDDEQEKERIETVIKERGLKGCLFDHTDFRNFYEEIPRMLGIKRKMIDIETNEIDLM